MELYIDNTLYDIDPAENRLMIAFDASALGDIDSLREGRHYRLTIPASRRNRSIIGDRDRIRSFEMFNSAAHTARIEYDGVPLIEGTAYLTGCRQSSDGGSYSIEVVAGSHRWAKTASLRQLAQTGLEYACRFDSAAIEQSWAEDDATVRLLPVIRDSYDAQPSAVELLPVQHIPSSDDFHPFISVHKMLEAIFADAGYTVESRFFAGELFRSLFFSGQYHTRDTARLDARLGFRAGRSAQSEAAADSYGCVYADPYTGINTVGNLVDTVRKAVFIVVGIALSWLVDGMVLGFADLHIANLFTGFVCGVELWSFLENGAEVCDYPPFRWLRRFMYRQLTEHLGGSENLSNDDRSDIAR